MNPIRTTKITTAAAKPAVAGTMKRSSALSKRTRMPSKYRCRDCAACWEIATRSFNARSGGALRGPTRASRCCVCRSETYWRLQPSQDSICWLSSRICLPVTAPSRYGENNGLAWAHVIVSPQSQESGNPSRALRPRVEPANRVVPHVPLRILSDACVMLRGRESVATLPFPAKRR